MGRIFVSYSRHAADDRRLAFYLADRLADGGHDVFVDRNLEVGENWPEMIEQHLNGCDAFIVLLSNTSIRRPWVKAEVSIALRRWQQTNTPVILPVRVALTESLPILLQAAQLDEIQALQWARSSDDSLVASALFDRIRKLSSDEAAPAPSSYEPVEETGPVRWDSPFYVTRPSDHRLERLIHEAGKLAIVKGPQQTGKSSLLHRVLKSVRNAGYPYCEVDFQEISREQLASLDSLLRFLARRIAEDLGATSAPGVFWNTDDGPAYTLRRFIEKAVLEPVDSTLLLIFDHVDRVLNRDYRAEFFRMLRSWHGRQSQGPPWDRLNLILGYSMEPHLWIEETNFSDFNVGSSIDLENFELEQVLELNRRHRGGLSQEADVESFYGYVGGHPYLVRRGLFWIAKHGLSWAQLEAEATALDGPFGHLLQSYLGRLENSDSLKTSLRQILAEGRCEDIGNFNRLSTIGLIRDKGRDDVHLHCPLYEDFFRKYLHRS